MRRFALPVLLILLIRVDAWASARQDLDKIRASKRAEAVRIDRTIQVDGLLDEPEWALATPAIDFYQQQPAEFALATRRTEVRFLYDNDTLYVGAILYDPEPRRLITNELKRDFPGSSGDGFGLILDTFRDRRNAFGFLTNPGGAQRDSLGYESGRRNDANWHGVWFVRTAIREDGSRNLRRLRLSREAIYSRDSGSTTSSRGSLSSVIVQPAPPSYRVAKMLP